MHVKIYTDGAARGNPDGPGGYGTVLEYVDRKGELHTRELSGGYRRTTNNRMELMAVIKGLKALNRPCSVELYSIPNMWWMRLINTGSMDGSRKAGSAGKMSRSKRGSVETALTAKEQHQLLLSKKGHDGHPQNERCDTLATTAADGTDLMIDEGVL